MTDAVPPAYPPAPPAGYPPPPRRGRSASFWVALVLALVLGVSLLANLVLMAGIGALATAAGEQPGKHEWAEKPIEGHGASKIAVIEVRGVISSERSDGPFGPGQSAFERVTGQLEQARKDDQVKAIVLAIESPGGEVTASDAIHDAVQKVRAAGKPVVVHMGAVCASGGYYISAPADAIIASPTGITGSIGVIFQVPDLHKLLDDKLGVGFNVIKTGAFKDTGSPFRPMRDDERALMQAMIDQMYQRFVKVVAEGRAGRGPIPTDPEAAIAAVKKLADGRIYSGEQALANGLADELGHIDAAYAKARELGHAPDARIIRYRRQGGLLDLFNAESEARLNLNAGVQIDASALRAFASPRLEYRWAPDLGGG